MATQATPERSGPAAAATPLHQPPAAPLPETPTAPLAPADGRQAPDALTLLDHRARRRTIAPALAPRGHYLALRGGGDTRLLRLDGKITHIGRGVDCDVRLEEHRVSRSHAILVRYGDRVRLLDNRSSNGTYVNGRRVVATNLESGDVILVGPVAVQYLAIR